MRFLRPHPVVWLQHKSREWWPFFAAMAAISVVATMTYVTLSVVEQRSTENHQNDRIERLAEDTNAAVELLEGRTPLFGELQATENRVACISELNAGAIAAALDFVASLAQSAEVQRAAAASVVNARSRLALIGTPDDPCL